MKTIKIILFSILTLFLVVFAIGWIVGNNALKEYRKDSDVVVQSGSVANENKTDKNVDLVIDANQFARISSSELVEILGEPDSIEDFPWKVPSTGERIVGKLYVFENNKYEFILFDDSVARLSVYSGTYWGYDDTTFSFSGESGLFSLFDITPNDRLKKTADTGSALRFSPVSDTIADFWIIDINNGTFGGAKITYNLNYF